MGYLREARGELGVSQQTEMITTILLIRHGDTGIDAREQEPDDPLSAEGRKSVARLAQELRKVWPITAIYASPYRRALETAEILAEGESLRIDNRLREIPLWASPNDLLEDETRLELMESLVQAQDGVQEILEDIEDNFSGKTVALVCHGNIIRATLSLALKMSLESVVRLATQTASVTILERVDDQEDYYRLALFNGRVL